MPTLMCREAWRMNIHATYTPQLKASNLMGLFIYTTSYSFRPLVLRWAQTPAAAFMYDA
jgi:hypothetical protein